MRLSVLCASDSCSRGENSDLSGPLIFELLSDIAERDGYAVVPDEKDIIAAQLVYFCDELGSDIVITTGGTGFAPRDVTPEATKEISEKDVPGISEAIRAKSLEITPKAMLSRAAAGIRGKTLIINLPGSPKAVRESVEVIRPVLVHAAETLSGIPQNCGGNYEK